MIRRCRIELAILAVFGLVGCAAQNSSAQSGVSNAGHEAQSFSQAISENCLPYLRSDDDAWQPPRRSEIRRDPAPERERQPGVSVFLVSGSAFAGIRAAPTGH